MTVHLVDGTYELFRHYFGGARARRAGEEPVWAARGVVRDVVALLESGARHVGVATDHVIESFRNEMWPGYKTGAGIPDDLLAQFGLVEEALAATGVALMAMVDLEADDALAAAARTAAADPAVERVVIMSPDKDLAQCVVGDRVVQMDRRADTVIGEQGVVARYGVPPASIPDWLALVGDSADGFPGLRGWGRKGAAAVLARHPHLEDIPDDPARWKVTVRGAAAMAATLASQRDLAVLFRDLATLRADAPVIGGLDDLRWTGVPDQAALRRTEERLRFTGLADRLAAVAP